MFFWVLSQGLGATYYDHLRLIGKLIVDFLLVYDRAHGKLYELYRKNLKLPRNQIK